jgi:hypothetical protein
VSVSPIAPCVYRAHVVSACACVCLDVSAPSRAHRYLLFALYLAADGYGVHEEDEPLWLVPELQKTSTPSQVLGSYIKALQPMDRGGNSNFKGFHVQELPENPSAAGIRQGFIGAVDAYVSDKAVSVVSGHAGHDPDHVPNINFYRPQQLQVAKRVTCTAVGWPAPEYGRPGPTYGPFPATLNALDLDERSADTMDRIMNATLNLSSATDVSQTCVSCSLFSRHGCVVSVFLLLIQSNQKQPRFHRQGVQREVVKAAFATLIMHYEAMLAAGEATTVLVALQHNTRIHWLGSQGNSHDVLCAWGKQVADRFHLDNLPVQTYSAESPQLTAVMEELVAQRRKNDALESTVTRCLGEITRLGGEVQRLPSEMETRFTKLLSPLCRSLGKQPADTGDDRPVGLSSRALSKQPADTRDDRPARQDEVKDSSVHPGSSDDEDSSMHQGSSVRPAPSNDGDFVFHAHASTHTRTYAYTLATRTYGSSDS